MEQQEPLLSVSFLPTKQDYADYQLVHAMQLHRPGSACFCARPDLYWWWLDLYSACSLGVGNPQNMVFFSLLVLLGLAVGFFSRFH